MIGAKSPEFLKLSYGEKQLPKETRFGHAKKDLKRRTCSEKQDLSAKKKRQKIFRFSIH